MSQKKHKQIFQPLAWHHARHMIPADWEVTSYSVEKRAGRLELSSRHGVEAVLSWEPVRRNPDPVVMANEFLRRMSGKQDDKNAEHQMHTARTGVFWTGDAGDNLPLQALTNITANKVALRWVFHRVEQPERRQLIKSVLESFIPNNGETIHYSLFGLNFMLPAAYQIEDITALPANVMMAFETRHKERITFRRWGLPEMVLQGKDPVVFYDRFLATQGCRVQQCVSSNIKGKQAVKANYSQRGQHQMDRFMGRPWSGGEAWMWINNEQQRIYCVEQIGPANFTVLPLNEIFPQ